MPEQTKGIRIVATDLETGEVGERVIWDDVCVITAGSCYIDSVQDYPAKGTQVYVIKGRAARSSGGESQ